MSFSSNKTAPNNVSLTDAQTLSNKTLDSSTVVQAGASIATPDIISPNRLDVKKDTYANLASYASGGATNGQMVFATDTKVMYQVVDGALTELSGGAGGINYLSGDDTNFENGVGNWVGTDAVRTTISSETVNPLRGSGSLNIFIDDVGLIGDGALSPVFTIDKADLAKKMIISFDYDVVSSLGNNEGDIRVVIVQDPLGTPKDIYPNGEAIAFGKGIHYAQFQTDAAITTYQIRIETKVNQTTAPFTMIIDNISVGPQIINHGAIVTDWEDSGAITIESSGTNPTKGSSVDVDSLKWKRVGDSMELQYDYYDADGTGASIGTGFYKFKLPNGYSIDTAKLNVTGAFDGTSNVVGNGYVYNGGGIAESVSSASELTVHAYDSNYLFLTRPEATASLQYRIVGETTYGFVNLHRYTFKATVPIQGWASTAKMSSDFSGRDIYFHAYRSANQTISGSGTINFDAELSDSTSHYDTSTYTYTIPETGRYLFSAGLEISVTPTAGQVIALDFKVNGTDTYRIFRYEFQASPGSVMQPTQSGTREINLNKGDTVTVEFIETFSGTLTLIGNNSSYPSYFSGHKLASPQTQLENETVAARYTTSSGQAQTTSKTTLIYENLDYDTHNAYNAITGIYTVPLTGKYRVSAAYATNSTSWSATDFIEISIQDGSAVYDSFVRVQAAVTTTFSNNITDVVNLVKGQELKIQSRNSRSVSISANSQYSNFSISRIK